MIACVLQAPLACQSDHDVRGPAIAGSASEQRAFSGAAPASETEDHSRVQGGVSQRTVPPQIASGELEATPSALPHGVVLESNPSNVHELVAGGVGSEAPAACEKVKFFDFYRNGRFITADTAELARLQIHIDYHTGAGCIAPDGNGTDLIVHLNLRASEQGCFVDSAQVRAVDWGQFWGEETGYADGRRLRFDFVPFQVQAHGSLTDPDTGAVVLHDPEHKLSLMVRRKGVLFYEGTQANSVLHTEVDTQGEESGCCWPATSTAYREVPGFWDPE